MSTLSLSIAPLAEKRRQHIAIIGAGFVGLCSGLWLQRSGHKVTVIDPAPPLDENSYRQACSYGNACTFAPHGVVPMSVPGIIKEVPGMLLSSQGPLSIIWRYLPQMVPWLLSFLAAGRAHEAERIAGVLANMLHQADAAWKPLMEQANAAHMRRENGCLYLYKSEAEFRSGQYGNAMLERHGVTVEHLKKQEIKALEPNLAPVYESGIFFPDAYTISSPHRLAKALAASFLSEGGEFIQCEASAIQTNGNSVEIKTPTKSLASDHVVIAAGAHSKRFTRQMGERILLDTERGYHVLFPQAGSLLKRPVCYPAHGFYMVPMEDGLRAVGTVEFGGLKAPPNPKRTAMIRNATVGLIPGVGEPGDEWMGFRPSMPDSLPVIGPSKKSRLVTYAFGHGHLGLTLGALTGYLVAQSISGEKPLIDLTPLRPGRF